MSEQNQWVREAGGSLSIIDDQGRHIAEIAPSYWNGRAVVEWTDKEIAAHAERLTRAEHPVSGMAVPEAITLMRREAFGNRHRAIGIDITIHDKSVEIQFSAYDGREHYYGATLDGAVKSCLVANNEFSGTQEETDRVIQEAMDYQQEKL